MNNAKKKTKMKGLKTPGIFVSVTGWYHNRKGKIWEEKDTYSSMWLIRKQKDYDSYSARLRDVTATVLLPLRKERKELQGQLIDTQKDIEELQIMTSEALPETVAEKRQVAAGKRELQQLKKERVKMRQRLDEIRVEIETSEHETEELLEAVKKKAEALMVTYLQGAGKSARAGNLLTGNKKASDLYQQYCGFEYVPEDAEQEEKEVEVYV